MFLQPNKWGGSRKLPTSISKAQELVDALLSSTRRTLTPFLSMMYLYLQWSVFCFLILSSSSSILSTGSFFLSPSPSSCWHSSFILELIGNQGHRIGHIIHPSRYKQLEYGWYLSHDWPQCCDNLCNYLMRQSLIPGSDNNNSGPGPQPRMLTLILTFYTDYNDITSHKNTWGIYLYILGIFLWRFFNN